MREQLNELPKFKEKRADGYQTVHEIAVAIGKSHTSAQRMVKILFEQGKVEYIDTMLPAINGVNKPSRLYKLKCQK